MTSIELDFVSLLDDINPEFRDDFVYKIKKN